MMDLDKKILLIAYNGVLFMVFFGLTMSSLGDMNGLTDLNELALSLFGLFGILSQLYLLNKKLYENIK
jgi:hypothetical protein